MTFMSWFEGLSELSAEVIRAIRGPDCPAKIAIGQLVVAANEVGHCQFLDRTSADINTVARLHSPEPFSSFNEQFRSAVLLKPGKPFGLAAELECPALEQFCSPRSFGAVTLDIREITCLSASKGPLASSETLDDFAVSECRREIGSGTSEQLEACLRYYGVRLASPFKDDGEELVAVAWSGGTICWPNSDGSHHFAAARYIAGVLQQPVPITASLTSYSISHEAVAMLAQDFFAWVMPDHDKTWLFIRMIHQYGLEVGIATMPRPYRNKLLILLPRGSAGASQVKSMITASGATPFSLFTDIWLEQQRQAAERCPTWFAS